jgi:hypothetical protein
MVQDVDKEREFVDDVLGCLDSLVSTGHANGWHRKDTVYHCPSGNFCIEQYVHLRVQTANVSRWMKKQLKAQQQAFNQRAQNKVEFLRELRMQTGQQRGSRLSSASGGNDELI